MSTKSLTNAKIEEKIIFALSDAYPEGETSRELAKHIGLKTGGELKRYYDMLKPLRKREVIKGLKKGRDLINFLPGNEELARKKWKIEKPHYQELQLDFRPDIIAWHDQLSYWDEFFTPWIHSKKIMFDGRLPVENEPTYPYFKKYVESKLEKIEKTPDLSLNPFDEQDKLKKMMKKFNEIRDKILDEFKSAMENRMQDIKSILPDFEIKAAMENRMQDKKIILPDFNENSKQQLLKIVFMRITYKFLNQQNFGKKLSIVIGPDKNKKPFSMTKNKNLFLGNMYEDKDIKDIINLLSEEIKKSNIITRESIAELWTMVSESQMICTRIIRVLKVLQRIK